MTRNSASGLVTMALASPLPAWWLWVWTGVVAAVLAAAFLAVALAATAGRWLVGLIARLDGFLTWTGFGKWMAGFITRLEMRMAARRKDEAAARYFPPPDEAHPPGNEHKE